MFRRVQKEVSNPVGKTLRGIVLYSFHFLRLERLQTQEIVDLDIEPVNPNVAIRFPADPYNGYVPLTVEFIPLRGASPSTNHREQEKRRPSHNSSPSPISNLRLSWSISITGGVRGASFPDCSGA